MESMLAGVDGTENGEYMFVGCEECHRPSIHPFLDVMGLFEFGNQRFTDVVANFQIFSDVF